MRSRRIVDFSYSIHPRTASSKLPFKWRYHLDLSLHSPKLLWVHQFMTEMLDFQRIFIFNLNNFNLSKKAQAMVRKDDWNSYMTYSIKLLNPHILLPNLTCNDVAVVDLGELSVTNHISFGTNGFLQERRTVLMKGTNAYTSLVPPSALYPTSFSLVFSYLIRRGGRI